MCVFCKLEFLCYDLPKDNISPRNLAIRKLHLLNCLKSLKRLQ